MDRIGIPATTRASSPCTTRSRKSNLSPASARSSTTNAPDNQEARQATAQSKGLELRFPEPAASSPTAAADELVDDFEMLEDWTDRYDYIISMGEKLPPMPVELKTEANRVRGCQSTVHLFARRRPGSDNAVDFLADSDADIVRGLIAILEKTLSGQRAREILSFDIEGFLTDLGLDQNLSMGRRNGLSSMIQRIRAYAKALQEPSTLQPVQTAPN